MPAQCILTNNYWITSRTSACASVKNMIFLEKIKQSGGLARTFTGER